jgi:uncharacterized protein YlzI (FlbEa/FlbD family)
MVVREGMTEIIEKVVHYRRLINRLLESEYERQSRNI